MKLLRATEGLELVNLLRAYEGIDDPEKKESYHDGFDFIESVDPKENQLYRYTLRLYRPFDRDTKWLETLIRPELIKKKIEKTSARYGILWDDISTKEDREKWIAGSSLKVVDLQAKEVIAERIGYMMDKMQGNEAHFRQPWAYAHENACPAFTGGRKSYRETSNFIFKALIPSEGK